MTAIFHSETARNGEVYRAARLSLLKQRLMQHIDRSNALALVVEQALANLTEAEANEIARRH